MSGRNRFPFTANQWQELEHQALIFKYIVSGIPIPPDLLFSIKRSYLDSPFISRLFPPQYQDVGWSYLQMGSGRKMDSEPGRCRRTDGKKWRCSKEAYPDSKYCERHMHRGKNRSRKLVEAVKTTSSSNPLTPASSSVTQNNSGVSGSFIHGERQPFVFHGSSSSSPSGGGLQQNTDPPLMFDPDSYSHHSPDFRRSRYIYGLKEDVDEHPFLSGSSMEDPWQLTPLTMSCSSSSSRQKSFSALHGDFSPLLQLQSSSDSMGNSKMERDGPQKTMHHFFDEWSSKDRESWLDLDDKSSNSGSVSATRLSMSFPNFGSDKLSDN